MKVTSIRWMLTIVLLYGVFTETGWFTTVSLFLLFSVNELQNCVLRRE